MIDPEPVTGIDDAFLDRLVDGGLSAAEFRAAVARLEREPDGWKRCALAFLEDQVLRASFRANELHGSSPLPTIARPTLPIAARRRFSPAGWRRTAVAAGVAALSFALGWGVHADRRPTPLATADVGRLPSPEPASIDDRPDVVTPAVWGDSIEPLPTAAVATVGQIRLGASEGGPTVPILAGPAIDERWLRDQPPLFTDHEKALLEQQGFRVDQERRLFAGSLEDGRVLEIPVDSVQLRYTGIASL